MTVSTDDLTKYRVMVGINAEDTSMDSVILIYLNRAEKRVIKRRYPFGATEEEKELALDTYSDNVDSLYVVLYNKQGAEGESAHNENGINRTYEDENVCLNDIVPMAKIC